MDSNSKKPDSPDGEFTDEQLEVLSLRSRLSEFTDEELMRELAYRLRDREGRDGTDLSLDGAVS